MPATGDTGEMLIKVDVVAIDEAVDPKVVVHAGATAVELTVFEMLTP
jgi:hypothetical protein